MSLRAWLAIAITLVGCTKLEPSARPRESTDSEVDIPNESGVDVPPEDAGEDSEVPDGDGGESAPNTPMTMSTPMQMETCSTPDALRCTMQAGQRQRCTGGVWTTETPCASGEVCTTQPSPGACQAVTEICRGSADQAVCDGRGVMYHCNTQGIATSQESCMTPQHCQLGISEGKCLTCVPSSYRCTATQLERCKADGSGYEMAKTCATAALCNAAVGDCTDVACTASSAMCANNVLRRCNTAQTGFEDVATCAVGLCDATNAQCDKCAAGSATCASDKVVTCAADGQSSATTACPTARPKCVGVGKCVECAADADCPDPGACRRRYCNVATGSCEPQYIAARTACMGGFCDGAGNCRTCLQDADCGNPGECRTRYCNPTTHACEPRNAGSGTICTAGYCDGNGSCVGCVNDGNCTDPGECRVAYCNPATRACEPRNAPSTTTCGTGGRHCSNGSCVQCANVGECADRVCNTKACSSGQCVYTPQSAGASCTGGVCTSSQTCRECVGDAQCTRYDGLCTKGTCSNNVCIENAKTGACGTLKVCRNKVCGDSCGNGALDTAAGEQCEISVNGANDWTCTSGCMLTGFQNTGLGKVCAADTDCGPRLTCDAQWFGTGLCLPRCSAPEAATCPVPAGFMGSGCSSGIGPGGPSCLVNCRSGVCPGGATCTTSGNGFCLSVNN